MNVIVVYPCPAELVYFQGVLVRNGLASVQYRSIPFSLV